jgi:ribosomal protein L3 glutamine methyltransferase
MFTDAAKNLHTVRDLLRFAVSRFNEAKLFFGHGTSNAYDEAAYLILHTLHLPIDTLDPFLDARCAGATRSAHHPPSARRLSHPRGMAGRT